MAKPQENVQAVVDVKKEPDDVLVGDNDEKLLNHEVKPKILDCPTSHNRRAGGWL